MSSACAHVYNVPGPKGATGVAGTNGTNGVNAFTVLTAGFVMPAVGDTVVAEVQDSSWIVPSNGVGAIGEVDGQVIVVEFAGSFLVTSVIDATHVLLYNLGYPFNSAPATAIPSGAKVSPGGSQGPSGTSAGGGLQAANNLADVDSVSAARSNLGLGTLATLNGVSDAEFSGQLSIAHGGTGAATAGAALTALSAFLAGLNAVGPGVADRMAYLTGVNTWALQAITAFARTFIGASTAIGAKKLLKVRVDLLCSLTAVDLNTAGDTLMTVLDGGAARYRITGVIVESASISLSTVTVGLFTQAGGIGTIAADQAAAGATTANKFVALTISSIGLTDVLTGTGLYFRVGTPQGAAATANVWIFGEIYTP